MTQFKRVLPLNVKSLNADGMLAGHASIFGNVDHYRDVVMPGAFSKSLAKWSAKSDLPPMLWQHQSYSPIGKHTSMVEDADGLAYEAQLMIKDVQQSREAYAMVKAGVIRGNSIGYSIDDDGFDYDSEHSILKLTSLELWENSLVTFPANDQALVTEVKDLLRHGTMPTVRQVEAALRDALGFTKSQAVKFVAGGYATLLRRDSDSEPKAKGGETLPNVEDLCAAIAEFKVTF